MLFISIPAVALVGTAKLRESPLSWISLETQWISYLTIIPILCGSIFMLYEVHLSIFYPLKCISLPLLISIGRASETSSMLHSKIYPWTSFNPIFNLNMDSSHVEEKCIKSYWLFMAISYLQNSNKDLKEEKVFKKSEISIIAKTLLWSPIFLGFCPLTSIRKSEGEWPYLNKRSIYPLKVESLQYSCHQRSK